MIQKANNPKLNALLDAARRATDEALHGPAHLRSGRYHPIPDDDQAENVRGDEPGQAPGKPERG